MTHENSRYFILFLNKSIHCSDFRRLFMLGVVFSFGQFPPIEIINFKKKIKPVIGRINLARLKISHFDIVQNL